MRKNKIKASHGERIFDVVNVIIMLLLILVCLYPMLHVLFASLSNGVQLMKHEGLLFAPAGFSISAYSAVMENGMIPSGYANTLFIVIVGTSINIILSSLGAYFLARKDQVIGKAVMIFIVITMFFSGGMIPGYLNVRSLGLYNSLIPPIKTILHTLNTYLSTIMVCQFALTKI